jgi:hypothetical protein
MDETLDEVLIEIRQELRVLDHLTVNKIRISTKEDDNTYGLKRSPTIRLNGEDHYGLDLIHYKYCVSHHINDNPK